MDSGQSISNLKNLVSKFCKDRDWDQFHTPEQLSIGIITEAAELLEIFRFKTPAQVQKIVSSSPGRERIQDELADILFFLLRFGEMNAMDLSSALELKLDKNTLKYPIALSKGKNLKYNELE